jgi:hypothetical protein
MNTTDILAQIDAEIANLKQARALIAATAPAAGKTRLHFPTKIPKVAVAKPKKKRNLTPEGRARIAAAVKARWAAQRKAGK